MMTKLRELRNRTSLSREDFALLAGVKVATVEKHEQGLYRISLRDAHKYAEALSQHLPDTLSKLLEDLGEAERKEAVA